MINLNKSSPNKFNLVFTKLPGDTSVSAARNFTMNIFGTILPGVRLDVSKNSYMGWQINSSSSTMEFSEWTFNFNVDENFDNWFKIFDWMQLVNNNRDYIYSKESEFLVDATLLILDDYNKVIKQINFKNMFPGDLESVNFSKREGESILESSVTMYYDYYLKE